MRAGAEDLLTKPVATEVLVQAIDSAHARFRAMREQNEHLNVLRTSVGNLTPRERQVFERVARGKMNKEIARELGSTERTIKAHRRRVMEKLHVTSLAELAIMAERIGIFASGEHPECAIQQGSRQAFASVVALAEVHRRGRRLQTTGAEVFRSLVRGDGANHGLSSETRKGRPMKRDDIK